MLDKPCQQHKHLTASISKDLTIQAAWQNHCNYLSFSNALTITLTYLIYCKRTIMHPPAIKMELHGARNCGQCNNCH